MNEVSDMLPIKDVKSINNYTHLKYRRQFIAAFKQLESFSHWQHVVLQEIPFHIYAHPDVALSRVISNADGNFQVIVIGFVIDPKNPSRGTNEIIEQLTNSNLRTIESVSLAISNLAGRFVLFVYFGKRLYVFHDPCGQRSVHYAEHNGNLYIASQPTIFSELFDLQVKECSSIIRNSDYVKNAIEYWFPSNLSLYDNIHRLIPNHYLDVSIARQKRYWPTKEIPKLNLDDTSAEAADILRMTVTSAHSRFKLALGLSAGGDSRVVLAASRDIINDIFIYSAIKPQMKKQAQDVKLPHSMLKELGIEHHILDWSDTSVDEDFIKIYNSNSDILHAHWCNMSYAAFTTFPQDRICVQGACSEIYRCLYWPHDQIQAAKHLIGLVQYAWEGLPLIENCIDEWLKDAKVVCTNTNIDILDLFFWEHLAGSWLAQSLTRSDISLERFFPFNYRPLLEKMLEVPCEYRIGKANLLYQQMIENLWPELLKWPINPPSYGWPPNVRLISKQMSINFLKNIGLYGEVRKKLLRYPRLHQTVKKMI